MRWFRKGGPKEVWETDDEGRDGDIEAARKVREICNSVAGSAERVAVLFFGPIDRTKKYESNRYERAKKCAEENVEKISDALLRDAAIQQVLELCMKANDVESAEALFHRLRTKMIKEAVMAQYPIFRVGPIQSSVFRQMGRSHQRR
jgi:hypothetical protein